MTGASVMMRRVDDEAPRMTSSEQQLAALDGKTGRGGCEYCHAEYEIITRGQGVATMRVRHAQTCPIVLQRVRAWLRSPHGFLQHCDPGDEQQ